MLLDPFEKQFHLPTRTIQQCNGQCRNRSIVGDKIQCLVAFLVMEFDPPQLIRISLLGFEVGEHDGLITGHSRAALASTVGG